MAKGLLLFSLLVLYRAGDAKHASRSRGRQLHPLPLVYPFGGTFKVPLSVLKYTLLATRTYDAKRMQRSIRENAKQEDKS